MKRIVIINGPNLDRLGIREPDIYGDQTLTDLENLLTEEAESLGVQVQFYQSNHEGFSSTKLENILTQRCLASFSTLAPSPTPASRSATP